MDAIDNVQLIVYICFLMVLTAYIRTAIPLNAPDLLHSS